MVIGMKNGKFMISGDINIKTSDPTQGRNELVLSVKAANAGIDAILWIDSDMVFPPHALVRLLGSGEDVIGCRYRKRQEEISWVGREAEKGKWELGFGLMFTRMNIFERIPFPWFDAHYEGNIRISEDEDFCRKVNRIHRVACDEELSREVFHLGMKRF
ncbi:MAG: hypothetical protein PHV34_17570 [Verrucomicrobiae bacterium]|nr:hypothetical protein [Verrucomicrobiae bacterium]